MNRKRVTIVGVAYPGICEKEITVDMARFHSVTTYTPGLASLQRLSDVCRDMVYKDTGKILPFADGWVFHRKF